MSIKFLTVEEHRQVVKKLVSIAKNFHGVHDHKAGFEYTSLMVCFLLHNIASADVLLRLWESLSKIWFPVTVGYNIVRSMFESDVTAHYISRDPTLRAHKYISFGSVLNKREMDAYFKHRKSKDPQWREVMELYWQKHWSLKESEINAKYHEVITEFENKDKNRKRVRFKNWSGKTIKDMAIEVDHEEAYDIFYSELSSFTHVDVHLADKFLHIGDKGFSWSMRASESDVSNVFRHAAQFLTCFLELFGEQFDLWNKNDVQKAWNLHNNH
jgi:hypothetical protein